LGQQEATDRLKARFDNLRNRFGQAATDVEEEWEGHVLRFAFSTFGVRIQGTVTSADSDVAVAADLPLMAMPMKGTIEQQIRGELEKILG
jgi:hypothetical protein